MMKRTNIYNLILSVVFLAASVLLAAGCSEQLPQEDVSVPGEADGSAVASKICASAKYSRDDQLAVCFSDEAIAAFGAELSRSGIATRAGGDGAGVVTRCGVEAIDGTLDDLDIVSIERVFPGNSSTEAKLHEAGLDKWYLIKFGESQDIEQAATKLAGVAEISKVQYDMRLKKAYDCKVIPFKASTQTKAFVQAPFNDPNLFWQWDLINNNDVAICSTAMEGADVNVAPAWELTCGDPEVIVAIIDEGVKYTHPDLAANMWTNPSPGEEYNNQDLHGWNFADDGPITWDLEDDSGHATHIAGTIAAVNNNGLGVCGIAGGTGASDGVKIMSCQIFSGGGSSSDVDAGRAIQYAAEHGASILQCSYGYESQAVTSDRAFENDSPLTVAAIEYFMTYSNCDAMEGGLVFFSTGNEGEPMSGYPGAYTDYISVASFGPDGLPTDYTNFGPGCNLAAPGGDETLSEGDKGGILSTVCSESADGEDYGYMQGTSMACPHASGVAALGLSYALQKGKHFTHDEWMAMVLTSVYDIESNFDGTKGSLELSAYVGKMGTGAVDAYRLLMQVEDTPCLSVPVGSLQMIPLTDYFGGSAESLTYTDVEMSEADMEKLGIAAAPRMYDGKLLIKCSSHGTAKIKVTAIAGGTTAGTASSIGGSLITKEFAIIARSGGSENGGWL